MLIKLSEYQEFPGFNKVASALLQENFLNPEDFDKLFPDQIVNITSLDDFFLLTPKLKNTEEFVKKLKDFNKFSPICIFGDYDKKIRKNS